MSNFFRGSASPGVIIGCALVWSWSDMAFLLGGFYDWKAGGHEYVVASVIAGMAACGIMLLLFAAKQRAVLPWLASTRAMVVASLAASASSLASIGGAAVGLLPISVAGSIVSGVCVAFFIAFWFGVACLDGAFSSIVCMSLAIAADIALDAFLMLTMKPLFASVVSAFLPLCNLLVYRFTVQGDSGNPYESGRCAVVKGVAGRGFKCEFFGLSFLLLAGLAVAEIGFDFMNYQFSFSAAAPLDAPWTILPFFIARGFGALICFVTVGVCRVSARGFFWVATMAMSLAFAMMPLFEMVGVPLAVCNGINCACFAFVAIFEIAVSSEVSCARKVSPTGPVCVIMFFLTGVASIGVILSIGIEALGLPAAQYSAITVAIGYAVVLGLFATVSAGQRYLDPTTGAASGHRVLTDLERQIEAQRQAQREVLFEEADVTDRERQVAESLLDGQSLRMISSTLGVSENTVKTHVQNIYRKFDVHSRAEMLGLFAMPELDRDVAYAHGVGRAEPASEGALSNEKGEQGEEGAARPALNDVIEKLSAEFGLTERESQVFALLARGYRNKEIQERLVISAATVRTHVAHIYAKMDLHSHSDLVALIKRER